MTIEELVTIIELRHRLKREITDEELQSVKLISTDPKHCYIDILNNEIPVKRYTSNISEDIEYKCKCFRQKLEKKGYNIKSFRYLDGDGNVVPESSCIAQQFSIAFINPN